MGKNKNNNQKKQNCPPPEEAKKEYIATITINLPSNHEAVILKSVLDVDEELQPHRLSRQIEVNNEQLIVTINAIDLKLLRTGVSSFVDMATVSAKTMLEFG